MYAHTNPLHTDVFPSVRILEAEVIAMTATLLGGGPDGEPNVCGAMTGGGTESILSAVKVSFVMNPQWLKQGCSVTETRLQVKVVFEGCVVESVVSGLLAVNARGRELSVVSPLTRTGLAVS